MNKQTCVGVDVAKRSLDVALIGEKKAFKKSFDNTKAGHRALLRWCQSKANSPLFVGMEATGRYGESLADYLHAQSIKVSVINPLQVKLYAKLRFARNKNDALDSEIIAHYLESFEPRAFQPRTTAQKALKELVQLRESLIAQKVTLMQQHAEQATSLARRETQTQINKLERSVLRLEKQLQELVEDSPEEKARFERLLSVPGIGKISAYLLLAYLPDLRDFKHAKQLGAYAGLSPRQRQSGQYQGRTRLSKLGHQRLRKALYMPAIAAKRSSEALRPFVERLEQSGLSPKAIVGAVMRKLLHLIFGMMKREEMFNPQLV